MSASVRTTAWTTSWGGNLCMFRSEINGHHENQEVCLSVFPPQVTAGETAIAQLEPIDSSRQRAGGVARPWRLVCDDAQLGSADSDLAGITFSLDRPGKKLLLAMTSHAVLARTGLIVHGQVDDEIAYIVGQLDPFEASRWFRDIVERHRDDGHKDKIDLILGRFLDSPIDAVRKTAFTLLLDLHDRTLRRVAGGFFGRDRHRIDDAVQEASKRGWRSLKKFRAGLRFGPWIHGILLNACRDVKREGSMVPDLVERGSSGHDEAIEAIDSRDDFDFAMRKIGRPGVELLMLRHGQDMGFLDIARTLDIQPDRPDSTRVTTVRRRVERLERDFRAARGFRGETGDAGGIT